MILPTSCERFHFTHFTHQRSEMPRVVPTHTAPPPKIEKRVEFEKLKNYPNHEASWILKYILVEVSVAALYRVLGFLAPAKYHFEEIFLAHCLMAVVTCFASRIKGSWWLLHIRSFFSAFHFACFLYATIIVPIILTTIAMPIAKCDHQIHLCVPIDDISEYDSKLYVGWLAQAVFGLLLFGKMKVLRLLAEFHYVEPTTKLRMTVSGLFDWPGKDGPFEFVTEIQNQPIIQPINPEQFESSL